jgi:cobalt/nickel transport system permease protein
MLAVHIADGVLAPSWLIAGFVGAAGLALVGAWRIRDEEIPQVALLATVFFVASLIHVNVGPTSIHLLLNGLVGVILGRQAGLAIPVALFLQAVLIGHGGLSALGVNSCVMTIPALLAWLVFAILARVAWNRRPGLRALLVGASVLVWVLSLVYGVTLIVTNWHNPLSALDPGPANRMVGHPTTLLSALGLAGLAAWGEQRLENAPEFPLGLVVGELAVLATAVLNALVLKWGGQEDWSALVLLTVLPHVVIALVEGIILGFAVGFLARVKPDLLHGLAAEEAECTADPLA